MKATRTQSPRPWMATGAAAALLVALAHAARADDPPAKTASPPASPAPKARPDDVKSLDAIMAALYDVISGEKGQARDWDRFRSLFVPGARMIPCRAGTADRPAATRVLSVDEFVTLAARSSERAAFYESEIARKVERFGHIAHVFSTYESRNARDAAPFSRGINSFQLFWDGTRWWVVTIYWDAESPDQPIPAEYLPKAK